MLLSNEIRCITSFLYFFHSWPYLKPVDVSGDFLILKKPRELPNHLYESVTDSVIVRVAALWCVKDVSGDGT